MQYIERDYCYSLNSEDLYDPELPLHKHRAKGGTMVLWRRDLDPYIKVIPVSTAAFLPIVLTLPDTKPSVHVSLYLPTHGQDVAFISELANLKNCLNELNDSYDSPWIYLRGDANVNTKNNNRVSLLCSFREDLNLTNINIEHKTYHHFVGDGLYDSNLDVILHSKCVQVREVVTEIICQTVVPAMNSHHDAIVSEFSQPECVKDAPADNLVTAPRLNHQRYKIEWSEEGINNYSTILSSQLRKIRNTWLDPTSQASMSMVLQLTSSAMISAAIATNDSVVLQKKLMPKKIKLPQHILRAKRKLNKAHNKYRIAPSACTATVLRQYRRYYHQAVRAQNMRSDMDTDKHLYNIMGENPGKVFRFIKFSKNIKTGQLAKLTVGPKTYWGAKVADGFFDSMSSLKSCDMESLESVPELSVKLSDHEIVMKICQNYQSLPHINLEKSTKILMKIKKNVKDRYSITSQHYINAGQEGLVHFNALLNSIVTDVNNAGLDELNTAHGIILFKGHRKLKTSDRSYRTISSCPFLSKALDMYIRELCLELWQDQQACTQYQGTDSSHELAALLLTEVIEYSMHTSNQPLYLLALDAQSAFDRCLRQVLTSEMYKSGMPAAAIIMIDKRLRSRTTVYEWEGVTMGPSADITGFEQGAVNSSDYYKLYNNEQLKTAQESKLGVDIGSMVISAIGQADDVILASSSLYNLQLLVTLTEYYCAKFRVKLEPSKTKLLVYAKPNHVFLTDHALNNHTITINKSPVAVSKEAEHVGILRSPSGNLPHILNRVAMHKNALHGLLPAGISRRSRGNPAACLRLATLYATPVLMSGLASLVLRQSELDILDGHFLGTLRSLLKLYRKTPRSIVYFLAGSLPARALLHLRQLSLFAMICHLQDDPLHTHACYVYHHTKTCNRSWFMQMRDICKQYGLPHPLHLLSNPVPKKRFKKLVTEKVNGYWQKLLMEEALSLSSLSHFNPAYHPLSQPHPMWKAAGSNPHEVNKTVVLSRMISGRYRTEKLSRFWTDNRLGYCLASTCHQVVGDLPHLLLHCPSLQPLRASLYRMWLTKAAPYEQLYNLTLQVLLSTDEVKMRFILDPLSFPTVISLVQLEREAVLDIVFYMSRTFVYALHRKKLILIGKWPFSTHSSSSLIPLTNVYVSGPPAGDDAAACDDAPQADVVTDSQCVVIPVSVPTHTSTACHDTPQYQALAGAHNISHNPCVAASEHLQLVCQLPGLDMRNRGGDAGGRGGRGGGVNVAGNTRSLS